MSQKEISPIFNQDKVCPTKLKQIQVLFKILDKEGKLCVKSTVEIKKLFKLLIKQGLLVVDYDEIPWPIKKINVLLLLVIFFNNFSNILSNKSLSNP